MFVAKLIGEADGHTVSREFEDKANAIQWAQGAGLAEYDDQMARGEVWSQSELVWNKSHLQGQDQRERSERRDATRFLARLNLSDKGRR
jgi:hypothetical protein